MTTLFGLFFDNTLAEREVLKYGVFVGLTASYFVSRYLEAKKRDVSGSYTLVRVYSDRSRCRSTPPLLARQGDYPPTTVPPSSFSMQEKCYRKAMKKYFDPNIASIKSCGKADLSHFIASIKMGFSKCRNSRGGML